MSVEAEWVRPKWGSYLNEDARSCDCGARPELRATTGSDHKVLRVTCPACGARFRAALTKEWAWRFWENRDAE